MTTLASRPLRADARRNRERVVEAARVVFAEQGREAQMDDVARLAGVGMGTVYRHFPTKEALIEALAIDRFARVIVVAKAALERDDPWPALVDTLWAGAEILSADRAFTEILAELRGPMPFSPELAAEMNETFAELVRRAQASGELRADVVVDDVAMFMCGIGAATRKPHRCPDAWRRHLAIIIDGLRATSASDQLPTDPCT